MFFASRAWNKPGLACSRLPHGPRRVSSGSSCRRAFMARNVPRPSRSQSKRPRQSEGAPMMVANSTSSSHGSTCRWPKGRSGPSADQNRAGAQRRARTAGWRYQSMSFCSSSVTAKSQARRSRHYTRSVLGTSGLGLSARREVWSYEASDLGLAGAQLRAPFVEQPLARQRILAAGDQQNLVHRQGDRLPAFV